MEVAPRVAAGGSVVAAGPQPRSFLAADFMALDFMALDFETAEFTAVACHPGPAVPMMAQRLPAGAPERRSQPRP